MILADKIMENRKKNGWSQEELAEKLGVSRQSVSKWESAQAVPDMKKILQLSEIFGVSTDYLLKDEIEETYSAGPIPTESGVDEDVVYVSMEEANDFLSHSLHAASVISIGVMLCILSPVVLLILDGLAESGRIPFSEDAAVLPGLIVLILLIAGATALFLSIGFKGKRFEYLENKSIDTAYGVSGMLRDRIAAYAGTHTRMMIIGIMLCILSVIPVFFLVLLPEDAGIEAAATGLLLCMIAVGVRLIVKTCIIRGSLDKLLEEGDYTRLNKKLGKYDGIYWALVTAGYLAWSFITFRWDITWIVWPVAGVLFAVYREICKAAVKSKER